MAGLMRAVKAGSQEDVKSALRTLLHRESIISAQEICLQAARMAIEMGSKQVVQTILTCDVFERDHTRLKTEIPNLLYQAASTDVLSELDLEQIVNTLILVITPSVNRKKIMNFCNEDGFSSLHLAATDGNISAAKRLLNLGVEVNQQSLNGNTALSFSIANNRSRFWQFILPMSDVNTKDEDHDTPLMFAAWREDHRLVSELIERGADVNSTSRHGSTALWNAVFRSSPRCVIILLQSNADVNICCEGTQLFLAERESHGTASEVEKIYEGMERSLLWVAVDNAGKNPDKHKTLQVISAILGSGYDVTREQWIKNLVTIQKSTKQTGRKKLFLRLKNERDLPCNLAHNQALQKLLLYLYRKPLSLKDMSRNCLRNFHRQHFCDMFYQKWVSKLGIGGCLADFMTMGYLKS